MTAEEMFNQLAVIKQRLETYPCANHEARCMSECMVLLIRTIVGEKVPELLLANIGGGTMEPQNGPGIVDRSIQGEMRGGVEISPGCVQYPAAPNQATMDVEAAQRALHDSQAAAAAPVPADMPTPIEGSIMAMALQSEGKPVETIEQVVTTSQNLGGQASSVSSGKEGKEGSNGEIQGIPPGIPAPSETQVEITTPGKS